MERIKSDCHKAPVELMEDKGDFVGVCTKCGKISIPNSKLCASVYSRIGKALFSEVTKKVESLAEVAAEMALYRSRNISPGPLVARIYFRHLVIEGFRYEGKISNDLETDGVLLETEELMRFLGENLNPGNSFILKDTRGDGSENRVLWEVKNQDSIVEGN